MGPLSTFRFFSDTHYENLVGLRKVKHRNVGGEALRLGWLELLSVFFSSLEEGSDNFQPLYMSSGNWKSESFFNNNFI